MLDRKFGGTPMQRFLMTACLFTALLVSACSTESSSPPESGKLIDYTVINRNELGNIKLSYDLRVDLVNGRLPTADELEAVSRYLHRKEKRHDRTFVTFYLPGMEVGAGAFATAHHDPNLEVSILEFMIPDQYKHLLLTSAQSNEPEKLPTTTPIEEASEEYTISVSAKPVSAYGVEFTVKTNIPLPVEVMAGMSLKGQKPDDIYIGYSKRVKLASSEQTFVIDASSQKKKLPSGDYVAEVTFYPGWGAKNGNPKASIIKQQISDSVEVRLKGSGESSSDAGERNKLQMWVMENVIVGTVWNEPDFVRRLGAYERIKADRNLHEGFYFPKADMTILVNTYKGTVSTWCMGRASK